MASVEYIQYEEELKDYISNSNNIENLTLQQLRDVNKKVKVCTAFMKKEIGICEEEIQKEKQKLEEIENNKKSLLIAKFQKRYELYLESKEELIKKQQELKEISKIISILFLEK